MCLSNRAAFLFKKTVAAVCCQRRLSYKSCEWWLFHSCFYSFSPKFWLGILTESLRSVLCKDDCFLFKIQNNLSLCIFCFYFYFFYFLLLIVKIVITHKGRKDSIMTPENTSLSFKSCQHSVPCFEMGFQWGAHLANIFYNEICWVISFEFFLVFEWIVELSKRHGAGLKPAV